MNLERSLIQMDDSVGRKSLIRNRESKANLERSLRDDSMMDFDFSVPAEPRDARRFMETSNIVNNSMFTSNSVYSGSQTNISVVVKQKTDHLYTQFLEVIQSRHNELEVFETLQDLIVTIQNTIESMENPENNKRNIKIDSDSWLRQEQNTWQLLYCLYKDRLITQKEEMESDDLPLMNSEKTIVEHLYLTNATLREHQLIVDWLEQTSVEQLSMQVAHYGDRSAMAWENTLHQLQNVGRTMFGGNRETVKSMDPDAPVREKLPLHDLDQEDQNRLSKQIFQAIRQGRIDEAQSLCEHCGQPWRAALLEGWRLYHDPNVDTTGTKTDTKLPIEGNPRRDLWKKCAWMMADSRKVDDYSRAIAGSLCGHIESLTSVLGDSWMDLLWAYLKIQIDIRVESEIRSCCIRNYSSMPEKYWNSKMSLEQIFNELEAHKNIGVKATAKSTISVIQKYLILDDIPALMSHINRLLDEGNNLSPQLLRFLGHLVLFIRQIGRNHPEEIGDRVIKSYVQCLIKLGDAQLVAFYTAALPGVLQVQLYSEFLETIPDTINRKGCLEEGQGHGLDISAIAKMTVERIQFQREEANEMKLLAGQLSELDKKKISSLELLTFYPEHRGDLLWEANAMMRYFLAANKIEAVKSAFNTIPTDSIQILIQFYGGKNNLPAKEECSIKEYLCHQTYLGAIEGYNDWIEFYYNKKPKEPQTMAKTKNFTERTAVEHQEQIYQADLTRWKMNLSEQTRTTKDLLYNVLLFPDKGWMVDTDGLTITYSSEYDVEMWENRRIQMENLRKLHIPDVVSLLHKVLTLAEEHRDCLKLCDELASENHQLYKVFAKHKLAEFISKVAESSLALMNDKNDSFGYTMVN